MRGTIISTALVAMAIASIPMDASASGGRGGFRAVFGAGGNVPTKTEEQREIKRGKSQTRRKITCKKCEYNKRLNRDTANEVALAVIDGRFDLDDDERMAVLYYLHDRYDVDAVTTGERSARDR